jgi:hypothetical protein
VFDLWVEAWRRKAASGEMVVVRYADDLVVGFEQREDAERFLKIRRFVVRRDWNFAEVEFGGHGSVMVRRGFHLGKKGGHAALSKVPVPSDNKSLTTNLCGRQFRLPIVSVSKLPETPFRDHFRY